MDEMISPLVATGLRSRGVDVVAVQEHRQLRGTADRSLLEVARDEGRVVVTNNVRDFRILQAEAARQGLVPVGVILIPSNALCSRPAAGRMIDALTAITVAFPGDEDLLGQELWL